MEVLDCATNEKKLFVMDSWVNKESRRVRAKAWKLGDQNIYRVSWPAAAVCDERDIF